MFNPFKKKREGDVIDLTLLQKRGLLKPSSSDKIFSTESIQTTSPQDSLSQIQALNSPLPQPLQSSEESTSPTSSMDMGFFSAMASSAEPSPSTIASQSIPTNSYLSSQSSTSYNNQYPSQEQEYQHKDRMEKVEGRVEHTLDRIYKILQRIEILERKIERLEKRSGFNRFDTQ